MDNVDMITELRMTIPKSVLSLMHLAFQMAQKGTLTLLLEQESFWTSAQKHPIDVVQGPRLIEGCAGLQGIISPL